MSLQTAHLQCRLVHSTAVWPCSLIKDELEPYMRDFSPAVVSGMYFERLSFGLVPMSILGVRIVPSFHANQHVSIGECPASLVRRSLT